MNTLKKSICNFEFEYFKNDQMALSCIGQDKEWEQHITNFTKVYNKMYCIENIIDIGANFGYHTLFFSREVNKNVFSFEPQIQNFELLENNIKNNTIKNVIVYNFACGDTNCDVKLPIIDNYLTLLNMGDFTPDNSIKNNFSVTKSVLLDEIDFNSKIDLIKIDVQGWELKVLKGAVNLLKNHTPVLIIEFENHQLYKTNTTSKELFNFIRSCDYYIYFLENEYPCDHVCVHNDKLDDFKIKFEKYIFPHNVNNHLNNNVINGVNQKISFTSSETNI